MSDEDAFQAHLDQHPDDHTARLVFADWLQERDDPRAEGYRALGVLRKLPDRGAGRPLAKWWWFWTNARRRCHELPDDWWRQWRLLVNGNMNDKTHTRRYIDNAAALAFSKLPAERRAELLMGVPA